MATPLSVWRQVEVEQEAEALRSCCWGIVKVAKMCSRDNLLGLLLL